MKMNGLKKAPRKKGATATAATDKAIEPIIPWQPLYKGGDTYLWAAQLGDEIEIKAKVIGTYNIDTEVLVLRAEVKELYRVLKKVGLNLNNIKNSAVELKLYNNEHSLHGNIMRWGGVLDEIIDLSVKLEKSGKDTDDQILQIIKSQKEVEKDGAYVIIRIHPNSYPADAGKIKVIKASLYSSATAPAAEKVEEAAVEEGKDREITELNRILTLEKTGYGAYRDGKREAMRAMYVFFSGVLVRADITSTGNIVVKIQERRGAFTNALDGVNNTFSSVYKAIRDRDIYDLLRRKVSSGQLTVDNNIVQYKSFEEVAEDAIELWDKYATQSDGGADSAAPADSVVDSDRLALAKVKFQGFDTGKGEIENLVYDDEKKALEITITKAKFEERKIYLFNDTPNIGGLKLTFVMRADN